MPCFSRFLILIWVGFERFIAFVGVEAFIDSVFDVDGYGKDAM